LRKELEVAGGSEGARIRPIFTIGPARIFAIPSRQTRQVYDCSVTSPHRHQS
jgi:hypothetical protein